MKTLIINAHPDFNNIANHYSLQLQQRFIKDVQEKYPNTEITTLNLYQQQIPRLEYGKNGLFTAWNTENTNDATIVSAQQAHQQLLAQFLAHHRIVITLPLHNFNIPSRLKDYLDNIMIAGKAFRYVHNGSVPLLTDNRKLMVLQASGSIYTQNDRYADLDFSVQYLKEMFTNIMGFNSFELVRAQGTSTSHWNNHSLEMSFADLDKKVTEFYS
ncbi:NAD(P)H-dependent oxidoreductase [Limosilactobacillus sp. STM2_1]|uniref:FMN dependent NADH:quinone oxidoreductase n=1 Tax=Limosilactobacillus rudii TaxID=2759755 RepID=A0A7W3ULM8_9LACO|nr:NAD(P)H-dependent oxidoreductase [Limosilactobacillus rudii]MBB1079241.1 NAD(P)H-dependent oxidoreductase [Limosilactobacillus rudii]MBB1097330.1 NAD(P)H-dependent oxidoreductase [Limosilactobacillus rudii]MCD7134439.1 NAD(P)H-dependent oxidoreductase [Limosilactobacillus rudii]